MPVGRIRVDRGRKLPTYAEHGVAHAWVVEPEDQVLEILKLRDGQWVVPATFIADAVVRAGPFDAIEIDLASIWGPPPS